MARRRTNRKRPLSRIDPRRRNPSPTKRPRLHRVDDITPFITPVIRQLSVHRQVKRQLPSRLIQRFAAPELPTRNSFSRYLDPSRILPNLPIKDIICAKRAIRREVLFASGKGGSRVSKPKFTPNSRIRC